MKSIAEKEVLEAAGALANIARTICGGTDFTTGRKIQPLDIMSISEGIAELRRAIDRYDEAILELHYVEKGIKNSRMVDMG